MGRPPHRRQTPHKVRESPESVADMLRNPHYYYWIARGVDERPVRADRIRKSVGAENTFATDLSSLDTARAALKPIIDKVGRYCEGTGIRGRTVTLKVKYADFSQVTRSRTGTAPIASRGELEQASLALLEPLFPVSRGIRLLGVTLSALNEELAQANAQLRLMV
jgi:DNA polymerase IV